MRKYIIISGFAIIIIALFLIGCQPSAAPPATPEQPVLDIDITEVERHEVSEEVETGDVIWKVREVENLGAEPLHLAVPGQIDPEVGMFIRIDFSVQTTAEEPKMIYDLRIIDEQGRIYNITVEGFAFIGVEDAFVLQELEPNLEYEYSAIFDVNIGVDRLVLEVTDLDMPPEEWAFIDLGI